MTGKALSLSISSYIWLWFIFDYLGISQEVCVILWILIVFDFLLGIAEARKNKIPITSEKMKEWTIGKIMLFLLPLLFALAIKWMGWEDVSEHFMSLIIWTLIASECYSALGHIYNFKTGEHLPENEAVSILIKKIWEFIKNKIDWQK
jgi:hypothetical protein